MNWKLIWENIRKYLTNKYLITLLVFAVVFVFVGEQSLICRVKRARQIHETEQQVEAMKRSAEQDEHQLQVLQSTDSLERYAREHYYMHESGEDVYVVDE